jgi:uncharacterized caspase-like protein
MLRALVLLLGWSFFGNFAYADKLALIIGVNNYDQLPRLQKAVGDSQAVAETFQAAGYHTTRHSDLSRERFLEEWAAFRRRIRAGDEVAFVFSGHGLEIDGFNYLLFSDAPRPGRDESVIRGNAIQVAGLIAELQRGKPRVSLVILDACRNNPYAARGTRSVGTARGLAPMDAPAGAFVMYSAGAGEEALDRLSDADEEPTSVYTRRLLPLLKTPNLRIQDVALQVREEVSTLAAEVPHEQNPAYYDDLRGKFCFSGCSEGGVSTFTISNSVKKEPAISTDGQAECSTSDPKVSCLWARR